jgi:enterochelin esterase family protein
MSTPTLATLSACCLLALPLDAQRRRERSDPPTALKSGHFTTDTFESEAVGRAQYGIYLPKGYEDEANAERRYPLVVWLHGLNEDERRFAERGGAEVLDRMIGDGEIPELILVSPDGSRSFYINSGDGNGYEDLVTTDLLAHLEKTYRLAEGRAQRALMGVSMGGYGALKIAFKRPELFGAVAAHSAAILPRDPDQLTVQFPWLQGRGSRMLDAMFGDPIDRERWDAENVLALADRLDPAALSGLHVYVDCGDQDRYGFEAPNWWKAATTAGSPATTRTLCRTRCGSWRRPGPLPRELRASKAGFAAARPTRTRRAAATAASEKSAAAPPEPRTRLR